MNVTIRLAGCVLAVATLGLLSNTANAQSTSALAKLEVALWPEYDRPKVLVVYRIVVRDTTQLPTVITVPIPTEVGEPLAVARRDTKGALLLASHTRRVDGAWAYIDISTDSRSVQLEYYAPLDIDSPARAFSFRWPGGAAIDSVRYEVQVPALATDFSVVPASTTQGRGRDQLLYHGAELGRSAGASPFAIDVRYRKPLAHSSMALLRAAKTASQARNPAQPGAEPPSMAPERITPPARRPLWPFGLFGLLGAGILGFLTFGPARPRARISSRSPAFVGGYLGILTGLLCFTYGGASQLMPAPSPLPLSIACVAMGALLAALCLLALGRSRVGWSFALSLSGAGFIMLLFGAPRVRDGLDVGVGLSFVPSLAFGATAVLLAVAVHDYSGAPAGDRA